MAVTYCTAQNVKDTTRNSDLKGQSKGYIEGLIIQAELIIDSYCGFIDKQDAAQTRSFPQAGDDTGVIPEAVKYATIYQVEYMHESQPDIEHGETDEGGDKNTKGNKFNMLSYRAKQLLKGYRNIVGSACVDHSLYGHDRSIN